MTSIFLMGKKICTMALEVNMMSVGLLILFLALTIIDAQNSCMDSRATCINVYECSPIMEILRDPRRLKAEKLQMLRETNCGVQGNVPLVCCENQSQPTPTPTPTLTPMQGAQETPTTVPDPPDVSNHRNLRLLEHQTCGHFFEKRLIPGNKTGIFDYPWMALIAYDTGRGVEFRCSGTILNKRYILTAAHCVTMLPGGLTLTGARVGDHDISKELDCEGEDYPEELVCTDRYQDFGIDSIHYHPEFTRTNFQNDIALIRLNATIDFKPFSVKAICMPLGNGRMLADERAVVTGWNLRETDTRSQGRLQKKVPLVSNELCNEIYKNITQVWYKQLCTGHKYDALLCRGNGGGPLQALGRYNNNSHKTNIIQYGIVSYGPKQCGIQSFPHVYTNVAYYMDWILDTIRE